MEIFDQLKPFIDWIHNNPELAWLGTFIISLAESLAIIGLIIPGSVMMTAIGILIGSGVVDFWSIMIAAILGAIVGDSLSYRIGYYFNEHIREMWPFRRYPQFLAKGEKFFLAHGGKSVFMGRFVGPVRPMIPVIAGMMRMPGLRFVCSNVFSAILWAPFYMLPGMLIGYASLELDPQTTTRFVVIVVVGLIAIGLTAWLFKIIIHTLLRFIDRMLDRLWAFMKDHRTTKPLCLLLADPRHPHGHGQLTLAILTIVFIIIFSLFSLSVNLTPCWDSLNLACFNFAQSFVGPKGLKIAAVITLLGNKYILLSAMGIIAIFLLLRKKFWAAWHLAFIVTITVISAALLKHYVDSPRPGILSFNKNSFPSAHAALSIGCYGFLGVILARDLSKHWRVAIFSLVVCICALVIATRLYLGVHWVTDVIAGSLLGFICASIVTISYCRRITSRVPELIIIGIFTVALIIGMAWRLSPNFPPILQSAIKPATHEKTISMASWWNADSNSLPMFRLSRSGKPIQLFNLQWADSPEHIRQALEKDGWQSLPKFTLTAAIYSVTSDEKGRQLPYLPKLNNGKNSVLIMYKTVGEDNVIAVVRLWPSNMIFTDSTLPLLVGTINYQLPRKHHFWKHKNYKSIKRKLLPATELLSTDLGNYKIHQVVYPMSLRPKRICSHNEWRGGVLYIRPKK